MLVLSDFLYILNLNNRLKFRVPSNVIVDTIICEIDTINMGILELKWPLLQRPWDEIYAHTK